MDIAKTREQLMLEIERVLDVVREGIRMHAGNVELVDVNVESGQVKVRLYGACVGCPLADLTLKAGIEDTLKMMVPEVTEVVAVR